MVLDAENIVYSKFPVLDFHDEFILRQPTISDDDVQSMYEIYTDPKVIKFVPDGCIPHGMSGALYEAKYYANTYHLRKSVYWFIARRDNNKAIGTCGMPTWDKYNEKAELSYNILGNYHSMGIMTKAIARVVQYGFEVMQLKRIESQLDPDNIGSIRVLEKNGFQKDGILPKYRKYKYGKHIDVLIMSIIDTSWAAKGGKVG